MTLPNLTTTRYPESDGKPMGETDEHRDAMIRIIELLKNYYRGQKVYVSGNILLYYEQGNPKKFVVPDAFIAKGLSQRQRRIYRLWVERVIPQVVIETTSKKTRKKDTVEKSSLYSKLGIPEYFLHDPTSEYLDPPLQGYRLINGKYEPIGIEPTGGLYSEGLEMELRAELVDLNLYFRGTEDRVLTDAEAWQREAEARQRETEGRQREAEARQREAEARQLEAEARLKAEAEVAKLRKEIERLKKGLS